MPVILSPKRIASALARRIARPVPKPRAAAAREYEAYLTRSRDGRRIVMCGTLDGYVIDQVRVAALSGFDRLEVAVLPIEGESRTAAEGPDDTDEACRQAAARLEPLTRHGVTIEVRPARERGH